MSEEKNVKLNLEDADLRPYIIEHKNFCDGVRYVCKRGRVPKQLKPRIYSQMAARYGFVKILGFYIRANQVKTFHDLIEAAMKKKTNGSTA